MKSNTLPQDVVLSFATIHFIRKPEATWVTDINQIPDYQFGYIDTRTAEQVIFNVQIKDVQKEVFAYRHHMRVAADQNIDHAAAMALIQKEVHTTVLKWFMADTDDTENTVDHALKLIPGGFGRPVDVPAVTREEYDRFRVNQQMEASRELWNAIDHIGTASYQRTSLSLANGQVIRGGLSLSISPVITLSTYDLDQEQFGDDKKLSGVANLFGTPVGFAVRHPFHRTRQAALADMISAEALLPFIKVAIDREFAAFDRDVRSQLLSNIKFNVVNDK